MPRLIFSLLLPGLLALAGCSGGAPQASQGADPADAGAEAPVVALPTSMMQGCLGVSRSGGFVNLGLPVRLAVQQLTEAPRTHSWEKVGEGDYILRTVATDQMTQEQVEGAFEFRIDPTPPSRGCETSVALVRMLVNGEEQPPETVEGVAQQLLITALAQAASSRTPVAAEAPSQAEEAASQEQLPGPTPAYAGKEPEPEPEWEDTPDNEDRD